MRSTSLLLAVALSLALAAAPPAAGAQRSAAPVVRGAASPDSVRARRIAVARDIIRTARFAALITEDAATGSSARTIDPAPPDSAMVIRFVTNPRSRKVAQIARDGRVTLYYFDAKGMRYVTLQGVAREVRESARKVAYWYAEWTPFYPGRERGAAMYEVVPRRLEVVSEADGVMGDSVTWAVPSVRFPLGAAARR